MTIVRAMLGAVALFAASGAQAQSASYKLVLLANNSAVVIEYPTLARCKAAAAAASAEATKRMEDQQRITPGYITDAPLRIIAFCLPG